MELRACLSFIPTSESTTIRYLGDVLLRDAIPVFIV